jgi:hypothetical protein
MSPFYIKKHQKCIFNTNGEMYIIDIEDGLFSQGRRQGRILKTTYFLENYIATNDRQCRRMLR